MDDFIIKKLRVKQQESETYNFDVSKLCLVRQAQNESTK